MAIRKRSGIRNSTIELLKIAPEEFAKRIATLEDSLFILSEEQIELAVVLLSHLRGELLMQYSQDPKNPAEELAVLAVITEQDAMDNYITFNTN